MTHALGPRFRCINMTADQAYACIFIALLALPAVAWVLERGNGGHLPSRRAAMVLGLVGAGAMLTPIVAAEVELIGGGLAGNGGDLFVIPALGLPLIALSVAWVILPLRAEAKKAASRWKLALLLLPSLLIGLPNAIYIAMAQ